MNWLLRPSILVVVSAALALGAAVLVLRPWWEGGAPTRANPRPVAEGDQEVVWLNAATSAVAWERFVTALRQVQQQAGDWQLDDANAFPPQTTAVPEVALLRKGASARLWFRWYKLTGDLKIDDWVEALTRRRPVPLAVIGGGSSDRARDLAEKLRAADRPGEAAPLLLITTATADQVPDQNDPSRWARLDSIYPGRTFRFCFSNRQMARAVTDFIWSQDDLRPDTEPVYLPAWSDDPYSLDLADGYHEVLGADRQRRLAALDAAHDWAWLTGIVATGGLPPGLGFQGLSGDVVPDAQPFFRIAISHSVGPFDRPNRPEADAIERLMMGRNQRPRQRRPLLVLPATVQPARRFLRGLLRVAPAEAGHFVVAGGDTPDFNTVYRDRQLTWPIQDLPFSLVFFCHRNPVDESALKPSDGPTAGGPRFTGMEDLRLYADIARAVLEAAAANKGLVDGPAALAENLRAGTAVRFDVNGNRPSGTGEYVVCLRPSRAGGRIEPRALLQVYQADRESSRRWSLVRELELDDSPRWPALDDTVPGGSPP